MKLLHLKKNNRCLIWSGDFLGGIYIVREVSTRFWPDIVNCQIVNIQKFALL